MKIEAQIRFNQWKTDLLNRLEEHLLSRPEPGFVVEHPEKLSDKLRVEVKEVPGQIDTWLVYKNGVKMGAFVGSTGQKEAAAFANKILNCEGTKCLPTESYYDRGCASDLPVACQYCGGRWMHLTSCNRPKQ